MEPPCTSAPPSASRGCPRPCWSPSGTPAPTPTTRTGPWSSARGSPRRWACGGATAEEYLSGGPRVRDLLHRQGVARDRWDPPRPDSEAPEAKSGLAPQHADDVRRWATEHGRAVRGLVVDEP